MISATCNHCFHQLMRPGAIILSPPIKDVVTKYHVCATCWDTHMKTGISGQPVGYTRLIPDGILIFQKGDMYTYWEGNQLKDIPNIWLEEKTLIITDSFDVYWRPM